MQKSLLSLIKEAKPRRALFTTYSFSIIWFETFILPSLRNYGCGRIDVLVDAREACKSTEESTSLHAGNGYRIIPVNMAGSSVFHPKLVYLEGLQNDHLIVSSANLTLAGYGKNLEVIDCISSDNEPAVFGEFASFIEVLLTKYQFAEESAAVLHSYAHRAQTMCASLVDEDMRRTWLVHTLEQSAFNQFSVLARRLRRPETLTVLSPYHTPSGAPVQRLAAAVHAPTLRIGVSPITLHAPFDEAQICFVEPVEYVVPQAEDRQRFPHAKCFELVAEDGVLVMTGSVNATSQSLERTNNVEVALVRRLAESPFQWEVVEPSAFVPCDFKSLGLTPRNPAVQATWKVSQHIVGAVSPAPGAKIVTVSIWQGADIVKSMADVALSDDGEFDVVVSHDLESDGALRVELTAENFRATGWLNVEFQLTATDEERRLLNAANRMRAGGLTLADMCEFISWLQRLASVQRRDGPSSRGQRGGGSSVARQPLSYEDWRRGFENYSSFGVSASVTRFSIEAALRWLNADVYDSQLSRDGKPQEAALSRKPRQQLLTSTKAEYDDGVDGDDDESHRQPSREVEAVFNRYLAGPLLQQLKADAHSTFVPMLVEISGCAVLKRALGSNADTTAPAELLVIDNWLTRFSKLDYSEPNREKLLPFFCAMACCAAHYQHSSSLQALKEALQSVARRAVPADEVEGYARMALQSRWFDRVPVSDHEQIATSARVIDMCMTLSQQLEDLVAAIVTGDGKATIPQEFDSVCRSLRQHRASRDRVFGNLHEKTSYCPCCFVAIRPADLNEVLSRRAVLCKNCGRALFAGLDDAQLEKKGLSGRYKR